MKKAFASFFGTTPERVFLFAKGRTALYAALKGLGIGPGHEVIMPGYTCVMVPSAPLYLGATCKYADIDPETYNLNPASLDGLYTPRTKALIVQHTYGISQDMGPVMVWAKAKGLPVIEDCCHVFGSKWKGRLCGTFGAASFFSGQWNKPFSTGLGGMLMVNDPGLVEKVGKIYEGAVAPTSAEELRLKAQMAAYDALVRPSTAGWVTLLYRGLSRLGIAAGSSSNDEFKGKMPSGYLKRMARCQEARGREGLSRIEGLIAHRKAITAIYDTGLAEAGFKPLKSAPEAENIMLRYPVRVANKAELLKLALKKGVELGSWFEIPLHPEGIDMEYFGYSKGMCPESEKACSQVINLPAHSRISASQALKVMGFLKRFGLPA